MDKQRVLSVAYSIFGRNGYRKTSMGDIATTAGVAKSALFYHFGSKEKLYFYLLDFGSKLMYQRFSENKAHLATGFFEKLMLVSRSKLDVMREYPGMLHFFRGVITEDEPSIQFKLEAFKRVSTDGGVEFFFNGLDTSMFKEDIDPKTLFRFIAWATEGGVNSLPPNATDEDIDKFSTTFYGMLDTMKQNFYK